MRWTLTSLATLLTCANGCSADGLALSRSQAISHLPEIVERSVQLDRLPATTPMKLRFVLPLQNEAGLDQLIEDIGNPQSPSYKQFLNPDTFAAQFHPSSATVTRLREALMARGLQPADTAHGAILDAVGAAADVEALTQTSIYEYAKPDGTHFFAPSGEVQLPADLPIRAIVGLHNATRYRNNFHHNLQARAATLAATAPQVFTPNQLKTAYTLPSNLNGAGQVVALMELDGFAASDPPGYAKTFNLPAPNVLRILLDNYNGAAGDASDEVTLDIEMILGLAPAAQVRVYEAQNSNDYVVGMEDIWNEMANPTQGDRVMPTIASTSWYWLEDEVAQADVTREQTIFKQMVAQGQTIFAAAGDAGATADMGTALSLQGPASQPYVVGVGGTLVTTNAAGAYQSETTWDDPANKQGGGGGISKLFAIPSYQAGLATSANKGSSTMRNVPDISLESGASGGGIDFFYQGVLTSGWGTSFSAPLWAGFLALVDQQRAQNGLTRTGYLNPILYRLGRSPNYTTMFHDINDNSTNGFYPAVTGFDDATGWGSFSGALLTALSDGYTRHAFVAPAGYFSP